MTGHILIVEPNQQHILASFALYKVLFPADSLNALIVTKNYIYIYYNKKTMMVKVSMVN